jgi:hypothetical protein
VPNQAVAGQFSLRGPNGGCSLTPTPRQRTSEQGINPFDGWKLSFCMQPRDDLASLAVKLQDLSLSRLSGLSVMMGDDGGALLRA